MNETYTLFLLLVLSYFCVDHLPLLMKEGIEGRLDRILLVLLQPPLTSPP
jgi:hypothetical protein